MATSHPSRQSAVSHYPALLLRARTSYLDSPTASSLISHLDLVSMSDCPMIVCRYDIHDSDSDCDMNISLPYNSCSNSFRISVRFLHSCIHVNDLQRTLTELYNFNLVHSCSVAGYDAIQMYFLCR